MPRFGIAAMFTVAALFVAEATLRELCAPLPLWERSDRIERCDPGEGFVSTQ